MGNGRFMHPGGPHADTKQKPSARRTAALGKRLKDLLEWLREARGPKSAAEIQVPNR